MKYLVLILAVLCLAVSCATPLPVKVDEEFLQNEDERALWHRAQQEQERINHSGLIYQDAEIENYLNRIAAKLQAHTNSPGLSFQVKVIKDPNLNAFAFPNGVIYVHTGVLARMDNEAQLAALLAHEMTHCTQRHSLRVLRSIKDRPAYIAAARHTLSQIAMIRELAQFLGVTGSISAVTGYTREFETEADLIGLDLIDKANYDYREALTLFEHLKQEIKNEGIEEPFFFGTHPNVQQRIDNLTNWLAQKPRGEDTGVKNSEIFQARMQQVFLENTRLDLRLGRFHAARRTVEKYLHMMPNDAKAHFLFGEIFRQRGQQGDTKKAVKYFKTAISLDPLFSAPHKALGMIHYKKGETHRAQKYFEACLLLSPNAADVAYIQGYLKKCMDSGEKS
jgi:predicted Zn-dependent protease